MFGNMFFKNPKNPYLARVHNVVFTNKWDDVWDLLQNNLACRREGNGDRRGDETDWPYVDICWSWGKGACQFIIVLSLLFICLTISITNIWKSYLNIFIPFSFSSFWKTITWLMGNENPFSEQYEILMNSTSIKSSLPSISYFKRTLFHPSTDMKYLYNRPLTRRFWFRMKEIQ